MAGGATSRWSAGRTCGPRRSDCRSCATTTAPSTSPGTDRCGRARTRRTPDHRAPHPADPPAGASGDVQLTRSVLDGGTSGPRQAGEDMTTSGLRSGTLPGMATDDQGDDRPSLELPSLSFKRRKRRSRKADEAAPVDSASVEPVPDPGPEPVPTPRPVPEPRPEPSPTARADPSASAHPSAEPTPTPQPTRRRSPPRRRADPGRSPPRRLSPPLDPRRWRPPSTRT